MAGADVGNYAFTISNANLLINPYQIVPATPGAPSTPGVVTLTATANNKVYNAGVAAVGQLRLSGLFAGDTLAVTSDAPIFADANVGSAKTVTFSGLALSGNGNTLSNYTLGSIGSTVTTTANITPAPLVLSSLGATTKVYDGTTAAILNLGTGTLSGVLGSDVVKFNSTGLTAVYNNKNVGTGKPLSVTAAPSVLFGADAGNYSLVGLGNFTGAITPKAVSVLASATSKTYTGAVQTQDAAVSSGLLAGDAITISNAQATGFNAGTYASSIAVAGADVGNYAFTISNANLLINPKPVSVLATATSKTYNGSVQTQDAVLITGLIPGDSVTVNNAQATGVTFGTYASNISVAGADIGNYVFMIKNANLVIKPSITIADSEQLLKVSGFDQHADYVTFKMPVLEFVPIFLGVSNVELEDKTLKVLE